MHQSNLLQGTLRASHCYQWAVAVLVCATFCGCRTYPEVCRKTLNELYYEAVAASNNTPERTGAIMQMAHANEDSFYNDSMLPVMPMAPDSGELLIPPPSSLQPIPLMPVEHPEVSEHAGWQKSGHGTRGHGTSSSNVRQVGYKPGATPLVTEFLEETDIRQALQAIASQAEVSLIIDEQVGGVVTAVFEDATFESALKSILMPLGLIYRKLSEKEYIIGVSDPSSALFSKLAERLDFRPMHLSPAELGGLIPERQQQFIQIVDNRNRILIEAPPEVAQSILERLQQFDTPIPQVELEAIVCVISPDNGFRSGLDWGHAVTLNGSELLKLGMTGLAFTGQGSGAGLADSFSDFSVTSAFVKLLAQEGYLAIRAAPRVTARDGDQAKIAITRESFFSTQPQTGDNFFRQDIESVQAGIELDITPVVRGNTITMKIEKAEVSEDIRTANINSGITENPYPQINRRQVSTTVHVKDGETIVIGGLVQRQTIDRIAKVPWLGDLPGVGRMFQTVEQTEQDAEVVIFISPRLVKPTGSCDIAN